MCFSINVDLPVIIIHISDYKNIFSVALFAVSALMFLGAYVLAPIVAQVRSARYGLFAKNTSSCARNSRLSELNKIGFNMPLILCGVKSGIQS